MIISLIVAASNNNSIGKNNQLLWHLPNDMRFFKNTTWAMPVIMGRKTFDSMGKPLTGRLNLVITRNDNWHQEGVTVARSLEEAINKAATADYKEVFIIGGGEIYRESLPMADRIFMTRVDAAIEGDAFFPEIDESVWKMTSEQIFVPDEKHAYGHRFQLWERIQS